MTITWTRKMWAATAAGLMVLAAVGTLMLGTGPSEAQPPPIAPVPLTDRHEFTDDVRAQVRAKPDGRPMGVANLRDASNLAVLEITIQPGAQFPWHTHPGPVLVAITDGVDNGDAFVFIFADDCVERPYEAGQAFVDLGKDVHMAYNPSDEPTVVIATFLAAPDADADDPRLTVPVPGDEGQALDDKCGIER
jgi:hypothetical protein